MDRSLTFVLPARDEEGNIARAVAACVRCGEALAVPFEVVVVDDGSLDRTAERAEASGDPRVRVVRHGLARGYGAALRTGFRVARTARVFFTDADLQFEVSELAGWWALADRYPVIVGYRAPRRDGWIRRLNGWAWSRVVDACLGTAVRDVDCAFKLFDRRALDDLRIRSDGAFVNAEIVASLRRAGLPMVELPVSHRPRTAGRASGARPAVVGAALRDLIRALAWAS